MTIQEEIKANQKRFLELCRSHWVKYIYAFGSSVTERFNYDTSDIDLLVDIDAPDPVERGEKLMSLWDALEALFQRKVDLLTESSIKNPFLRKSIDETKVLVYDGSGEKSTCLIY
ncbi:nucleotidyltransferase family protein [Pontibacter harenae]|uniref:nucleotidyltransferase family protein n=1 Tax=Pontibacter harenae TaxID=2894083 RepID=UPI001E457328|nr:nucleotidyltransferase domain-containing protein [Pontibacter harenae]MCC9165338.1 nucleotidyltransferase domain-containing protein [Pontibacter harenae]